jgi:hypothetical protein
MFLVKQIKERNVAFVKVKNISFLLIFLTSLEFLRDVQRPKLIAGLQRRLFVMGLLNILLSPFIFIFLIVYFFFKYGEEFHKNPTQLSSRSYSPLAKWKFRDFNELPHLFQQRLNVSYPKANRYIEQFPQRKLAILAKFISFVSGALALALFLLSIVDDDFLVKFHITPGKSVLWYLGILGMIWTASRGLVPDRHLVFDPEEILMDITKDLHYFSDEWKRIGLHSDSVRREFSNLFDYRVVLFVQELLSVILAPFVLWFSLPSCMPRLVDFFREFTVHVDGVGWICSFAVFDFRQTTRLENATGTDVHTPNKMERSAILFKRHHPEWEPRDPESAATLHQLIEQTNYLERHSPHLDPMDPLASIYSTASAPDRFYRQRGSRLSTESRLTGLDLATRRNQRQTMGGSTVLEGGDIPFVPYHMYAERQSSLSASHMPVLETQGIQTNANLYESHLVNPNNRNSAINRMAVSDIHDGANRWQRSHSDGAPGSPATTNRQYVPPPLPIDDESP